MAAGPSRADWTGIALDTRHRLPAQVTAIARRHPAPIVQNEQVQPAIVEQRAHIRVTAKYPVDRLDGGFHDDREPDRVVTKRLAVVHGLPRKDSTKDSTFMHP